MDREKRKRTVTVTIITRELDILSSVSPPLNLHQKGLVYVWQDTTEGDGCLNERVQLLITTDRELKMTWCDSFDMQVFCGISGQFKNFCCEILQNSGQVDGGLGTDSDFVSHACF